MTAVVVSLARRRSAAGGSRPALAHVLVVGGSRREWAALDAGRWHDRVRALGALAARAGASWLTLRAYGGDDVAGDPAALVRWTELVTVGDDTCTVIVDPEGDGRTRFAAAVQAVAAGLGADEPVTADAVTAALYAPADTEPDLVLVLGPPDRLPPSVVWELAYGELVFAPAGWDELSADHLAEGITAFAARERRFGGLG